MRWWKLLQGYSWRDSCLPSRFSWKRLLYRHKPQPRSTEACGILPRKHTTTPLVTGLRKSLWLKANWAATHRSTHKGRRFQGKQHDSRIWHQRMYSRSWRCRNTSKRGTTARRHLHHLMERGRNKEKHKIQQIPLLTNFQALWVTEKLYFRLWLCYCQAFCRLWLSLTLLPTGSTPTQGLF